MTEEIDGRAAWVERDLKITLTDFQRRAVVLLCRAMGCGPYDISNTFEKADWNYGVGVKFVVGCKGFGLSTFDFSGLTTLVIGAHEECIRVEIEPCNMQHLSIIMHPRQRDGEHIYQLHPSIEEAVKRHRHTGEPAK